MVSPHCDKTSSRMSTLWRGLTMGLAYAAGAAGTPNITRDIFESSSAGSHHPSRNSSRELLQAQSLPQTGLGSYPQGNGQPKIALAFLSMGAFPQETSWHRWFEAAHGQVPLAPLQHAGCSPEKIADALAPTSGVPNPIANQQLFSVYVHVPADAVYAPESIFAPYVIDTRLQQTGWGTHAITAAMRAVLAEGLKDERNQVFLTVSDDSVPLHPPTVFYQSSLNFPVSRINACLGSERTTARWHESMNAAPTPVTLDDWRKSSQWFQIKREHAAPLVQDTGIEATFRDYCYEDAHHPVCASDEHYPATVLSMLGHALQTDCQGSVMATEWRGGGAHPYTYQADDIEHDLLDGIAARGYCHPVLAQHLASYGFVPTGGDVAAAQAACESAPRWSNHLLGSSCPLLARKFAKSADPEVTRWLNRLLKRQPTIAASAMQPAIREAVAGNVTFLETLMRTDYFPDDGCASTRRDYVWPRGVFMDFTCPTGRVGDGSTVEALRCYAERPVCEAVISEKRRFFAVDSAFQDTLEGGGAMNDGIRVMRSLAISEKPSYHRHVTQGVLADLRDSTLSVPFYLEDFDVIGSAQRTALLSVLWFVSHTPSDRRDDLFEYYEYMLGRMLRSRVAVEMAIERANKKTLEPFVFPPNGITEFEAAASLAEAIARGVSSLTLEQLSAAPQRRPRRHAQLAHRIDDLVTTLGVRLAGAETHHPDIGWLTKRGNGFRMLAAVMVVQAQGWEKPETTARLESLQLAADTMQSTQTLLQMSRDLNALINIAQVLARNAPSEPDLE